MNRKPENSTTPLRKKAYSAPQLTRYGSVDTLVRSGTQPTPEGTPGPGPVRMMRMASDPAVKDAKVLRIGEHPLGIGLYLFQYRPEFRDAYGHGWQFGVMADEVEAVLPQAVSRGPLGHRLVDYAMLGVRPSAS